MRKITTEIIEAYKNYLVIEEKSQSTIDKYLRDVREFAEWLGDREFDKTAVLTYKTELTERYAPASVNTILSSLNSFFAFNEWYELKVKTLKIQKQIFASDEKELTKAEYERLLKAAKSKKNERLYLLMQTIWLYLEEERRLIVRARGEPSLSLHSSVRFSNSI